MSPTFPKFPALSPALFGLVPTWGPLIVINFFFGFFLANVSIAGHIGGIVAGLLATESMLQARRLNQRWLGYVGVVAVGVLAIIVALWAAGR